MLAHCSTFPLFFFLPLSDWFYFTSPRCVLKSFVMSLQYICIIYCCMGCVGYFPKSFRFVLSRFNALGILINIESLFLNYGYFDTILIHEHVRFYYFSVSSIHSYISLQKFFHIIVKHHKPKIFTFYSYCEYD